MPILEALGPAGRRGGADPSRRRAGDRRSTTSVCSTPTASRSTSAPAAEQAGGDGHRRPLRPDRDGLDPPADHLHRSHLPPAGDPHRLSHLLAQGQARLRRRVRQRRPGGALPRSPAALVACSSSASTRSGAGRRAQPPSRRSRPGSWPHLDAGVVARRGPDPAVDAGADPGHGPYQRLPTGSRARWRSSSAPPTCPGCRCRPRCSRSSSTTPTSKGCTCGAGGWPAAVSAGRPGARTTAPRCSGS